MANLARVLLSPLLVLAAASPALAGSVSVGIDMAKPLRLQRPAASVVVGNPAIADVQIQTPTLIVLQGKSYGTTNLIALDRDGREVFSSALTVTSNTRSEVTVERGIGGRITYACSGRCEPSPMPGDSSEAKAVLELSNAKSGAADGAAKAY